MRFWNLARFSVLKWWRSLRTDLTDGDFWNGFPGAMAISCCILFLWVIWFMIIPHIYGSGPEQLNAGTSGDMFGSLNALFSGLAFAGLISTLLMQRRELELQRSELHQTRQVFAIQQFENTLFGLLRILNDHVGSIRYLTHRTIGREEVTVLHEGRVAISHFVEDLPTSIIRGEVVNEDTGAKEYREIRTLSVDEIANVYRGSYLSEVEHDLGPYFRLLYNIFRHIDHAVLPDFDHQDENSKRDYAQMVRAQLSSAEVDLLAYNGVSEFGGSVAQSV